MLGKLLKNEFKSYLIPFGIVYLTGFLFTVFMKIMSMIPYGDSSRQMIQDFTTLGYYYIIMFMNTVALVLVVVRFYSTMVGDRGYLTWTLPASSEIQLMAKLISATVMRIITYILMVVFLVFFYSGKYWHMSDNFYYESDTVKINDILEFVKNFDFKYLIPAGMVCIAVFLFLVLPMLLYYMCISIGQLFGKWRLLASIVTYFIIIVVLQVVVVIGMVMLSMAVPDMVYDFANSKDLFMPLCIGLSGIIGVELLAFFGMFGFTDWIFKRHLNLD